MSQHLAATNRRGMQSVLGESALTGFAIFCSLRPETSFWLAGQALLGLTLFHWFVIEHSCGHEAQFRSRGLNYWVGHLASIFSLIPFFPWVFVHRQHHRWSGWVDRDPTTRSAELTPPPARVQRVIDLCWRLWIPIFSLVFATGEFWNPARVDISAPARSQRRRTRLSMGVIALAHLGLLLGLGSHYGRLFGVSFLVYLSIADPTLLGQHAGIPHGRAGSRDVRPLDLSAQDDFARTLLFPAWIQRSVFLNFNLHGLHHVHPRVPHYRAHELTFEARHACAGLTWLWEAKRRPASELLFGARTIDADAAPLKRQTAPDVKSGAV